MSALIQIKGLCKAFFGKEILRGVDLQLNKGETMVVLGESGTGKSVLLKHLIGLMKPDTGEIYFKNERVDSLNEKQWLEKRKMMSFVFQSAALFDSLSVFDNVAFPLRQQGMLEEKIANIVRERLHHVGLPHVDKLFPSSLSGGMKKRVSVARALVLNPEIVLYDEPTTGLDPIMTAQISEMIIQMKKDYGVTSIVVSHDVKSALSVADVLVLLYEGKVYAKGTVEEFKNSKDSMVRQFLEGRSEGPIDPLRVRS